MMIDINEMEQHNVSSLTYRNNFIKKLFVKCAIKKLHLNLCLHIQKHAQENQFFVNTVKIIGLLLIIKNMLINVGQELNLASFAISVSCLNSTMLTPLTVKEEDKKEQRPH